MTKKLVIAAVAVFTFIAACSKKNATVDTKIAKPGKQNLSTYATTTIDSPFLLPDTANIMIQSYLQSIKDDQTQLKSLIVDANALRYYLQNSDITHVKLMFAHRMDYIESGHAGQAAGLNYNAMTLVIAGFDEDGNYIYTPQGAVMDHCRPCPVDCPAAGTAASDILIMN